MINEDVELVWDEAPSENNENFWVDWQFATEQGAIGLTALLFKNLFNLEFYKSIMIGMGADYQLIDKKTMESNAFLEISGIWKESSTNTIDIRINKKVKQTKKSEAYSQIIYISVIEFSTPKAKIVKR